jgi:hypothetical protein
MLSFSCEDPLVSSYAVRTCAAKLWASPTGYACQQDLSCSTLHVMLLETTSQQILDSNVKGPLAVNQEGNAAMYPFRRAHSCSCIHTQVMPLHKATGTLPCLTSPVATGSRGRQNRAGHWL